MSKVTFFLVNIGPNKLEVVSALRSALGLGLQEITRSASSPLAPLFEHKLFDRADPPFAHRLLSLMSKLQALGASFTVYQLLDHQSYSPSEIYYEITIERLKNLIDSREESLREQRALGESGA